MNQLLHLKCSCALIPLVILLGLAATASAEITAPFWTHADALGPGWGLYPINAEYDGTRQLGPYAAHGMGQLTWVANFPQAGEYHIWVRRYVGYGQVRVSIDEQAVVGGRGGASGGRYAWRHLGAAQVEPGAHHVDIHIGNTMFDAVLLTLDASFDPVEAELSQPITNPVVRVPRRYRDDEHLRNAAGEAGVVVGRIEPFVEHLNDWMPEQDELIDQLSFRGAVNQYVTADFAVRALHDTGDLPVSLVELRGPGGATIDRQHIDLRVVHLSRGPISLFRGNKPEALRPDLLVYDDRHHDDLPGHQGGYGGGRCVTAIPAHESRQFRLVVHVSEHAPAGHYQGTVTLGDPDQPRLLLPVELEVLPLKLEPVEGYYSAYHRAQPIHENRADYVSPSRYRAELKDQMRHGLNTTLLYGGFAALGYVVEAGMRQAPCVMSWPSGAASAQIAEARKRGLPGLLYYGVDEPRTPEQIERARKEGLRRQALGLTMMMAVNDRTAQEALKDWITHPVYNLKVFYGKDNPAVRDARDRGFTPISYWGTNVSFPLYFRAFTGLYNTASGYVGSAPWAYYDVQAPDGAYNIVRPDEFGEPIPSLCWDAVRAGIDDVRYLQALDRAIAAAEQQVDKPRASAALRTELGQARAVRKQHYEPIGDKPWHRYMQSLRGEDLDTARRAMADATAALLTAMTAGD